MKIAWLSPLPPESTDIANFTERLMPDLRGEFGVFILDHKLISEINVEYIEDSKLWKRLNQCDFVIYNIGNNPVFHSEIWKISMKKPGIVVLHDESLQDLFWKTLESEPETYIKKMQVYYGQEGYEKATQLFEGSISLNELRTRYPLTELAIENSLGVVVHTETLFEKLKVLDRYPVTHIDLPYQSKVHVLNNKINNQEVYKIIIFGFIGPNRRLEQFLRAFSLYSKKDQFQVNIVGQIWETEYIKGLIQQLNIDKHVKLHGFVPEEYLDQQLSESDLAFNLRFPTMGEASGSQLRIWDHGLASVVTNVGWYSELPDDTVRKINIEVESEEIIMVLNGFLNNPQEFRKIGINGRERLLEFHTTKRYVDKFKLFLSELRAEKSKYLFRYSTEKVSNYINELNNNKELIHKVSTEIINIYKPR